MAKSNQIEQQKILRIFKLINLLRGNIGKPVHKLAETLGTDPRTIYRYFKLLEALGFEIEKEHSKFKILDRVEHPNDHSFGTFSDDEILFLNDLISGSSKKNLLKDSILQKISIRSDFKQSVTKLFNANLGIFVDLVSQAIKDKNQVILRDYYSVSSDSVADRLLEPVVFSKNFDSIYALEVESKKMKIFKIERIGEVLVTSKPFKFQELHEPLEQGLFGFSGKNQFLVHLKMTKKAFQLMIEEHPDTKPFTYTKNRNQYYFKAELPHLHGIARFILGLPGEIKVLEGEELIVNLREQLNKMSI
ncbi:transcriptional regulator [Rhodonellum psychrophilum GCM71 = DSM 17998]|uniref:Transcriptional regulator n=2 Tax=Rhodonellum TaxID=336827 RepID=U5BX74_9BACT|nr:MULTISPECIES: WYL domain-containing protein [Rhodonellum]ERM81221.1 transcriptional regulator [Rhodonellum psychrophilum GCM71 = DSM 17998]SDZ52278.1 Predicted DNA-binding transcriptional regulator YafY, contains an HTH and WYL domains [Rhodonellum ikkaensis]